jgi:magnesium chelatase family protein
MAEGAKTMGSQEMLNRVLSSRKIQLSRFSGTTVLSNSEMPRRMIEKFCQAGESGKKILKMAMDRLGLSARAYDKILRVARTIADLDEREKIQEEDIMEAIQYRSVDRILK